jgi:capsular polysaccharide biosynthesis protein
MTTPQKLQPGVNCLHHPKVPAVHLCSKCKTPVCATCDFTFPGDLHICPKCVENNDPVISPRRKRNVIWSLVCAVGGLVLFILFFVRAQGIESESDLEVHSTIFGFLIIVVAMVGVALGLGAMDKRLGNTMSMWIATVWNMVILGAFTLLCVVGLFMS